MGAVEPTPLPRAIGVARAVIRHDVSRTVLKDLYQQGCAKVRMPAVDPGQPMQLVLLNTSGGLTDGDCFDVSIDWQPDSCAIATTQAAERVYKSRGANSIVLNSLTIHPGATALWLPQETILFDHGRCERMTEVSLQGDASFVAMDALVCGRKAMAERVQQGYWFDRWRIRHDGALIFADGLRLASDADNDFQQMLARPAGCNGRQAIATGVLVSADRANHLERLRHALAQSEVVGGVSQVGSVICWRFLAQDGEQLRDASNRVFNALVSIDDADNRFAGIELPRVFRC